MTSYSIFCYQLNIIVVNTGNKISKNLAQRPFKVFKIKNKQSIVVSWNFHKDESNKTFKTVLMTVTKK